MALSKYREDANRVFEKSLISACVDAEFDHLRVYRMNRYGEVRLSLNYSLLSGKIVAENIGLEDIKQDYVGRFFAQEDTGSGSMPESKGYKRVRAYKDKIGKFSREQGARRYLLPIVDEYAHAVVELQLFGKGEEASNQSVNTQQLVSRLTSVSSSYKILHQNLINSHLRGAISIAVDQFKARNESVASNYDEFIFLALKDFVGLESYYRVETIANSDDDLVLELGEDQGFVSQLLRGDPTSKRTLRRLGIAQRSPIFASYVDKRLTISTKGTSTDDSSGARPNILLTQNVGGSSSHLMNMFAWNAPVFLHSQERTLVEVACAFHTQLSSPLEDLIDVSEKSRENTKKLTIQKLDRMYQSARHAVKGAAKSSRVGLEYVSDEIEKFKPSKEVTKVIKQVADRIDIIESRIEQVGGFTADRLSDQIARVSVRQVIADVQELNKSTLRKLQIKMSVSGKAGSVEVFETLFLDIVHNLVLNSIEAFEKRRVWLGKKHKPKIDISISTTAVDEAIEIRYSDNAGGIRLGEELDSELIEADEANTVIFDEKFTTKLDGTGFGLFLARSYALVHGGDLLVSESSAEGTVFMLTIDKKSRNATDAAMVL